MRYQKENIYFKLCSNEFTYNSAIRFITNRQTMYEEEKRRGGREGGGSVGQFEKLDPSQIENRENFLKKSGITKHTFEYFSNTSN